MDKFLIAGLGNIGPDYEHTRHNIGFDVLDAFVHKHGGDFRMERYAFQADVRLKGHHLVCIKPTTFMNLSGKAIRYWMDKEKISLPHILVVFDDLALPLEKLRLRPGGSDGGHNGLKDIQETLKNDQYPRLRFGIGNDYPKGRQIDFVLGRWKEDDMPLVNEKIEFCIQAIESFVLEGIDKTMNKVNNSTFDR
ncbi:MAG TPA: aminoacyl-tRNA hydrolase [Dinghuibacter sp.]|jgi:PTH1 family peptidyl-tRNA hydrolase|uniref:aminoacyl-tRNA hydrolase n=1 Tax=Dinghuibacter sp. TaxID=2024697 RepID=UPI002BA1F4BF|nr:aminoacyl-tRNA hydrolase [Dinghuibacter sp.]HTJ12863.1 aminoacyl-tRNA hydrolase [Dinghuibacter sp.]